MPALDSDIAVASRDVAVATFTSATIAARYPDARDGSVDAAAGYFDNIADAQAVVNARGALIGTERRRFTVIAQDLAWPSVSTALPQVSLIDAEQDASGSFLVARVELDLEADTTTYEVFG
uniref:hypothetical protein n=1 Tax=uncultured Sphingomonas sp. TaxID=158754 RepID=UPI0035C9C7B5